MINHSPQLLQENKIDKQHVGNIPNSQDKAEKVDKAVNADFSSKNYTSIIHKPNKIKKHLKKDENLRVTGRKMEELPKTDKADGTFDFDDILQNLKSASTSTAHTDSRRQSCLLDQGGVLVQKNLASPRTNQCT